MGKSVKTLPIFPHKKILPLQWGTLGWPLSLKKKYSFQNLGKLMGGLT
jgi:hypothetical protein